MSIIEQNGSALATLAAEVALLVGGPVMTRGGKLLSVRGAPSIRNLTAGDGPFLYGIAQKSLDLAQLTEYLELQGPVTPDAVPEKERAERGKLIRTLGIIVPLADGTVGAGEFLRNVSLSGFVFTEESAGWNHWIYNIGRTMTTGATWAYSMQFFAEFNPSG